ncbi:class I SAM-dependent methyltransferase [Sutcliffiella halmapala]|uniref:class I SAM-dependent methyltransferase n=1 Tax=Sutcliffiella halmapala TaxID=79882 RepID=UPI000994A7C0|nr:class I SAM-dependent methyltransferase [Sutcliffiella halmapala]
MNEYAYTELLALFGIGGAHPGGLELTKDILTNYDLKDANVLEVGCGTGQTSAYLHARDAKLTAIDYHPLMVEKANKRFKEQQLKYHALQMNIEETNLASSSFDFVIAESVLSFTNLQKSLSEIVRLLKANGKLVAVEMTKKKSLPLLLEINMKKFYGLPQILSKQEWMEAVEKSGFQHVQIQTISLVDIDPSEPDIDPSLDIGNEYFAMMEEHENLTAASRPYIEVSLITAY